MKKDNRGFSLIELVIILAVMAMLITIGVRNFGVLNGYRCRECKSAIVSAIQNSKVNSLSKSYTNTGGIDAADTYLEIVKDNNSIYLVTHINGSDTKREMISKGKQTNVYVELENTSKFQLLDSTITQMADSGYTGTQSIKIGFNRASGAFLPQSGGSCIEYITVKTGTYERKIELETKTGKVITN